MARKEGTGAALLLGAQVMLWELEAAELESHTPGAGLGQGQGSEGVTTVEVQAKE